MKNKEKKKCKKYKHTIGVNNGFCKWQVRYRTEKQLEHEKKCIERILREYEEELKWKTI